MDSRKQFEFSAAQKVYRPSPRIYLKREVLTSGVFPVVLFGFMLLAFLLIPIFTGHPERLYGFLPIGLILFGPAEAFFVYFLLWRTHLRLVTSVEGIGYSTVGYRIFTLWDNVAGVGIRREITGLELHQPAPVYKARPLVRFFLRIHPIARPSFIPISEVVENWQDSEVAADIQRYAPQVAMKMPLFRGASSPDVKRLRQRGDVEGLIAALHDPAGEIRKSAARALGEIRDPGAVDPLIAALHDPFYGVRVSAAEALGNIGDDRAVDPLSRQYLQDRELTVLTAILRALVQIEDARVVEALLAVQQNLQPGDLRRNGIIHALQQIQSSGRKNR